jgi:hypothetical protein
VYKTYLFLEGPEGTDPFRMQAAEAASELAQVAPEAVGCTQTRTLAEQVDPSTPPPYTGVLELWFATPEAALRASDNVASVSPLLSDATSVGAVVVGLARTVMRLPQHHHGDFIKGVFPFRRQDHLSVEDFQRYWWLNHGPIAALTEQAVCYLQCHPLPQIYAAHRPRFDGVTELHWPSVDAARSAMGSRQMTEDQASDAQNFAEPGSVVLFLAKEECVLPA